MKYYYKLGNTSRIKELSKLLTGDEQNFKVGAFLFSYYSEFGLDNELAKICKHEIRDYDKEILYVSERVAECM